MNPNSNRNPITGPKVFKPSCQSWQKLSETYVKQPDGTLAFDGIKCVSGIAR